MRKLLFLLPVAASALFLTGCDEVAYRERTVVVDGRPGYHGDADFYYVSSRPYSRSYGQLYLRSGRYYYSRGGTYHLYDRPIHRHGQQVRHVDRHDHRDRRDWDRGHDRDRDRNRRDYERVRYEQRDRDGRRDHDRDRDRNRDRRSSVQVRESNVYNVNLNRDGGNRRQVRGDERGGFQASPRQAKVTQRDRAQQAVYRKPQREGGERKRDRDRDRERRID